MKIKQIKNYKNIPLHYFPEIVRSLFSNFSMHGRAGEEEIQRNSSENKQEHRTHGWVPKQKKLILNWRKLMLNKNSRTQVWKFIP